MYRCRDCYNEFEEPKLTRDPVGEYHGQTAYEDWYVCPHCGSDDYEEIREEDAEDA